MTTSGPQHIGILPYSMRIFNSHWQRGYELTFLSTQCTGYALQGSILPCTCSQPKRKFKGVAGWFFRVTQSINILLYCRVDNIKGVVRDCAGKYRKTYVDSCYDQNLLFSLDIIHRYLIKHSINQAVQDISVPTISSHIRVLLLSY